MKNETDVLANMSPEEKRDLLKQLISKKENAQKAESDAELIPDAWYRFDKFPDYNMLMEQAKIFRTLSMDNPYFSPHEGVSDHITRIDGKNFINYSG